MQDLTSDGGNTYLYDAEGRICAFATPNGLGGTIMMGYIYNAEGSRVAKGTITTMTCDPATNGFTMTGNNTGTYVLGQGSEELTQLSGSGIWQRTNVYGGGRQLATYDLESSPELHFQLTDPLGTRRMQTDAYGRPETDIQSLPYGDGLSPAPDQYAPATADDATPLHFTGKERDTESGNDYFGARYFGSSMGRFMSPDPAVFSAANPSYPQTWNLYVYAANNPLRYTDPTGLDCVYYNDAGTGVESIDHHSDSGECKDNGGNWEEGTTYKSWQHYDKNSDTWNGASLDSKNAYFYQGTAPGDSTITSTDWGGYSYQSNCSGNCFWASNSTSIGNLQGQLQNGATLYGLLSWAASQGPGGFGYGNPNWVGGAQHDWINGNGNNWCGAGGAGVPSSGGDFACLAHDYNYATIGANWMPNNADPRYAKGPQLQKINQTLCDNSGFEVSTFFSLPLINAWGCK